MKPKGMTIAVIDDFGDLLMKSCSNAVEEEIARRELPKMVATPMAKSTDVATDWVAKLLGEMRSHKPAEKDTTEPKTTDSMSRLTPETQARIRAMSEKIGVMAKGAKPAALARKAPAPRAKATSRPKPTPYGQPDWAALRGGVLR
jgi:hypothetical protein